MIKILANQKINFSNPINVLFTVSKTTQTTKSFRTYIIDHIFQDIKGISQKMKPLYTINSIKIIQKGI